MNDLLDLSVEGRRGFKLYRKTDVEPEYYEYPEITQYELNMVVDNIQRAVDQHCSLGFGDLYETPRGISVDPRHLYLDWGESFYERQQRRNEMWEF